MALTPGTRIGPYEIVGAIGAGGMGEVYRARDTKLNREAAIKVLPAAFAQDAEGQVSEGGGVQARSSRSRREIHYRSGKRIVAVPIDASGAEPVFGKPTALFADEYDFGQGISIANCDVTPDGRFIMLRRSANGGKMPAVVNWTDELKRIIAAGGVR